MQIYRVKSLLRHEEVAYKTCVVSIVVSMVVLAVVSPTSQGSCKNDEDIEAVHQSLLLAANYNRRKEWPFEAKLARILMPDSQP